MLFDLPLHSPGLSELLEQIYENHAYELSALVIVLLSLVFLRLIPLSAVLQNIGVTSTPYICRMPAASPQTVST